MEDRVKTDPNIGEYYDFGEEDFSHPHRPVEVKHFTALVRGTVVCENESGSTRKGKTLSRMVRKCIILDGSPDVSFVGDIEILVK